MITSIYWESLLNGITTTKISAYSLSPIDAHNQDIKNIYQLKVCQTGSGFVDIYKTKRQWEIIVGSEGVRTFNYCGGNNKDGRTNMNYSLDLINNQTVMFNTFKFLYPSWRAKQRKLSNVRNYSTMNNIENSLIRVLNKSAKKLIDSKIWPMEDKVFRKCAIDLKKREEKKVAKQCTNIFKNSNEFISILTSNIENEEKSIINKLLKDASHKVESLVWKIIAIELISLGSGSTTPGIDKLAFKKIAAKASTKERALKILSEEIDKLKQNVSLAKGKTNQAIQRKGLINLNSREKLRREFKRKKRILNIENRNRLKNLMNDPIKHANDNRTLSIEYNRTLKWKLLAELKYNKLINYVVDPIKRVNIPKKEGSNEVRPLGIHTIRDRCVQMLLKLVLEPIMEPLGDNYSFGYRRGRSGHLAVSCLTNYLVFKRRDGGKRKRQNTFPDKVKGDKVPEFFTTKHVIDCDIKGFFDNIAHGWLIKNVPMPVKYEGLLLTFLKAPIVYDNKVIKEVSDIGIPQGGILSPLIANWTLDGLDELLNKTVKSKTNHPWNSYFYPEGKREYLEKKGLLENLNSRGMIERPAGRNVISYVRFADDVIIVTNNAELVKVIMVELKNFLEVRGLWLSDTKTKIIAWKMGSKLDFLGWTFILIKPKKVNWMIKAKRKQAGKLRDWAGLYCFPSNKSTKSLRDKVKIITSMKNTFKAVTIICQELSLLIRGWSNYFNPGGKQSVLRNKLDWYIDRRIRRYLFRKFGRSKIGWAINKFCRFNQKYIGLHTKTYQGIPSTFKVPRLAQIGVDAPWSLIKPDASLIKNSCIINTEPYSKGKILLDYLSKKDHAVLYTAQKGICLICNLKLHINTDDDENTKLHNAENLFGISHRDTWVLNNLDNEWNYFPNTYKGLVIDHLIPISLSVHIKEVYNILNDISNKQLIHNSCHKIKTKTDKIIIKEFKKIVNEINNKDVNGEVEQIHNFKKAIRDEYFKDNFDKYQSYKSLIKNI